MRDGAMTLADVELWLSHDISVPGVPPELVRRAQDEFLWLCAEHKAVGRRNGSKAGAAAEAAAKARPGSPDGCVIKVLAEHNCARGGAEAG